MQTRQDRLLCEAIRERSLYKRQAITAELLSKLLFAGSERIVILDRTMEQRPLREAQLAAMVNEKRCLEQTPVKTLRTYDGASRNGPCPCGSGKKFKRCCRTVSVNLKGKS